MDRMGGESEAWSNNYSNHIGPPGIGFSFSRCSSPLADRTMFPQVEEYADRCTSPASSQCNLPAIQQEWRSQIGKGPRINSLSYVREYFVKV